MKTTCLFVALTALIAPAHVFAQSATAPAPAPAAGPTPAPAAAPAPLVSAQADWSWRIGGKAGFLLPGSVDVSADGFSGEVGTESGVMVLLSADTMVAPRLSIGGFAFGVSAEDEAGGGFTMGTLGGTIKGRFLKGGLEIRPGLSLGYQKIDSEESEGSGFRGFEVGGMVEIAARRGGQEWVVEAGFISQPSGGDDSVEVTFGPIFYVVGGIGFGG